MLQPYYFYWFRIDNKHMTEPWLDQALVDLANRSDICNGLSEIKKDFMIGRFFSFYFNSN